MLPPAAPPALAPVSSDPVMIPEDSPAKMVDLLPSAGQVIPPDVSAPLSSSPALNSTMSDPALSLSPVSFEKTAAPPSALLGPLICPDVSTVKVSSNPNSSSPLSTAQKTPWTAAPAVNEVTFRMPAARIHKGVLRSSFPSELLKDQPPLWSKFIAGHFIGEVSPHIGKVHATVNRLWTSQDKKAKIDAQFISPKVVLFKIDDDVMRRRVLQRHFWHISNIPMIVQEWSPSTVGKQPDLSSIPLWVDFIKVPISLFSKRGLLFLGNLVGKAQKIHPSTEKCTRFDVARVLVEVNLNSDIPSQIELDGDAELSIPITYPWLPPRCSKCGCWGHKITDCISVAGVPLVSETSITSSAPEQSHVGGPHKASKQTAIVSPAVPDEVHHQLQPKTTHVQSISPETTPVPESDPMHAAPTTQETSTIPENLSPAAFVLSPSIACSEERVRNSDNLLAPNQIQDGRPSSPLEQEQEEQNWTIVSKTKGSPIRTIMTRGKCVAIGEISSSRYQILEKEPPNLDDIEDGEIQGSHNSKNSSSDEAVYEALAPTDSGQGKENRVNKPIKTQATRQKDKNKTARLNIKSKKSSSRKA